MVTPTSVPAAGPAKRKSPYFGTPRSRAEEDVMEAMACAERANAHLQAAYRELRAINVAVNGGRA